MADQTEAINQFLSGTTYAVAGASRNRAKYGNKVLRVFQQRDLKVIPVNPQATDVEGLPAVSSLRQIDEPIHGVAIITPPDVTMEILRDAHSQDIKHVWLQPGAEDERVMQLAEELDLSVVAEGPCLLVVLGFRESTA